MRRRTIDSELLAGNGVSVQSRFLKAIDCQSNKAPQRYRRGGVGAGTSGQQSSLSVRADAIDVMGSARGSSRTLRSTQLEHEPGPFATDCRTTSRQRENGRVTPDEECRAADVGITSSGDDEDKHFDVLGTFLRSRAQLQRFRHRDFSLHPIRPNLCNYYSDLDLPAPQIPATRSDSHRVPAVGIN